MKNLGNSNFSFSFISHGDIVKELNKLKSENVSQKTHIPIKIVKDNIDIISHFLYYNFNKLRPIHKKDKTDKTNYRPVSFLLNLSKAYERLMYN